MKKNLLKQEKLAIDMCILSYISEDVFNYWWNTCVILHNMLLFPLISINHPVYQHDVNSPNYSSSIRSGAAVKMCIILYLCLKKNYVDSSLIDNP